MTNQLPIAQRTRLMVRRWLPALVAACFAPGLAAAPALLPSAPQVVAGQATFSQQGNVFSITNTPGTIINWQTFSVGAGDITRFIQQSSDSAVLNRIVGQDPTRILGALQSNGHVFLINPNGIMFGRDARVDVNGLTASTLNLSNADFLAGRRHFSGAPGAGAIDNQGAITTPAGGKVFLLAPNVSNTGIITSPQGEIVLAAGHSVQLVDSANPDLRVVVAAPAGEALNLGRVVAEGGRIGIYGALVRQRGVLNADSARVGDNGNIVLRASGDTLLEAGSVTSATGAGRGGAISVEGERVGLTGDARIDASGAQGGGSVQVGGSFQGRNPLVRSASETLMGPAAAIRADALATGKGGSVVLWSTGATRAFGQISARGAGGGAGGMVETSGRDLSVAGLAVDAGSGGTWLLDPYDVVIGKNGSTLPLTAVDSFTTGQTSGTTSIDSSMFNSAAPGTSIVVQATHDITVDGAITRPAGTTGALTMQAGNTITIDAPITTSGGALTLLGNELPYSSGVGGVLVNADLKTGGGALTLGGNAVSVGGRSSVLVDSGLGNITLLAPESLQLSGVATISSAGTVSMTSDQMFLGALIGPSQSGRPLVSINSFTNDRDIEISGATSGSALFLAPGQLQTMQARQLTIGNASFSGNIRVDSPLGGTGQVMASPGLSLETRGRIDVNAPVSLAPNTASNLVLKAKGLSNASVTTAAAGALSADNVTIVSDNIALGAAITGTGTAGGSVTLMPGTTSTLVVVGENATDGPGQLGLDGTELSRVKASRLVIGGLAGQTGNLNVLGALNLTQLAAGSKFELNAGQGDLTLFDRVSTPGALLLSGGRIGNALTSPASASSIKFTSSVEIGDTANTLPFYTETAFLTADNVHPGGNSAIRISNTGLLNVGSVTQSGTGNTGAIAITNAGGMTVLKTEPNLTTPVAVRTNGGAITLTAQSPLTINGAVNSNGGAIALTAGNGGVLTIGSTGTVASGAGNINLTGGSIVHQGSITSTSGNITFQGNPVTGSGTTSTVSGAVTGAPLTLAQCTANPALPGCSTILPSLAQCTAAPTTPGCSAVLPTLAQCTSAPSTPGCSAVLPSVAQCTAVPSTPGCAVVLPTIGQCTAAPSTPGCSAVLPTLTQCTTVPSTPGCSAVLPSLAQCTAAPATPGCNAVLPSLSQCTSAPATPGCSAVLPSLSQCTAAPSTPGCSAVLPTLSQCTAAPSTPGCSAVLPTVSQCTAAPSTPGCSAVLPSLAQCTAAPTLAGCSAVLPSLSQCTLAPSTAGCSAVLPSLNNCLANPGAPGCSVVLPSLATCTAAPSTPGCSVVLPSIATCTAAPATAGCSVVLPSLSQCTAAPTTAGCSVVLPALSTCIAAPSTAGCAVVLPTLSVCIANPASAGCSVVLPSLSACVANPTAAGCTVVLPTLPACVATPARAGCSVILPSIAQCVTAPTTTGCAVVLPSLQNCVANQSLAGCSVVLPSLASCTANPALSGCSVVLPTLTQCVSSPALAGCIAVLPPLASCTANPSLAGCIVVLPSLTQCTAVPTQAGCSAVLPTLSQCTASPTLQGCVAVLPAVSACVANPAAAGCAVVVPPQQAAPNTPLAQASDTVVALVNNASGAGNPMPPPPPAPTGGSTKEESATAAPVSNLLGEKIDPRKKTYCN